MADDPSDEVKKRTQAHVDARRSVLGETVRAKTPTSPTEPELRKEEEGGREGWTRKDRQVFAASIGASVPAGIVTNAIYDAIKDSKDTAEKLIESFSGKPAQAATSEEDRLNDPPTKRVALKLMNQVEKTAEHYGKLYPPAGRGCASVPESAAPQRSALALLAQKVFRGNITAMAQLKVENYAELLEHFGEGYFSPVFRVEQTNLEIVLLGVSADTYTSSKMVTVAAMLFPPVRVGEEATYAEFHIFQSKPDRLPKIHTLMLNRLCHFVENGRGWEDGAQIWSREREKVPFFDFLKSGIH